jgi:hypothetical protein
MNLLLTEEEVIVQHILDLDARGFPPRLAAAKDTACSLLAECRRNPVGQNWAANMLSVDLSSKSSSIESKITRGLSVRTVRLLEASSGY